MMAIYAELARLIPDLHVILLGEGARLAQYREQLSALGLSDRFHLPGPVPDVGDYFEALDLCVHAVEEETFGLAVLEAMAKGLPVVAAATGGLTETVEDGVSGFLCRDGREMAERVLQLAAAPEDRQRMGAEGMRRAKLFDERRTALKHKLVYDEVIDGARYWWPPIAEG